MGLSNRRLPIFSGRERTDLDDGPPDRYQSHFSLLIGPADGRHTRFTPGNGGGTGSSMFCTYVIFRG